MKIRTKINVSFLTTFILVIFSVGLILGIYTTNLIQEDIDSYLQSNNRARAEHIRTFIQDQEISAAILAAAPVYIDLFKESINSSQYQAKKDLVYRRLTGALNADSQVVEAFILDASGKIVASSDKLQEGVDKSQNDYFIQAKDKVYFKDIYYSEIIKKLNYTVSAPIKDSNGAFLGVSVLRYLPESFFSIVKNENGLGSTEENFLINKDKFFITPSLFLGEDVILKQKVESKNATSCFDPKEIEYVQKNGYSGITAALGSNILETKDYRNIDVIAARAYIPETGWCLITKADKADLLSFRYIMVIIFLFVFFVAGLVFLLIGLIISRKITSPIVALQLGIEKIKKGDFDYKTNVNTHDEIGELSMAFDIMVSAVKQSRVEVDMKVEEQTREINNKTKELENQQSAVLNILEDVEKQKYKAEALSFIVRDAHEPIVSQSLDGIILSWNHGAEVLYGYSVEEMIGNSIKIIVPEDKYSEIEGINTFVKNETKIEHYQTVRKKKDGTLVDVSISVSPIKDFNGKIVGVSSMTMDITKEKEIDKAKTEFVSLASHQLRTPLSAINWYTEMLLAGDAGEMNDEQKKYLGEVAAGSKRMVELVGALLNVSRLDLGTFVIEPEPTNVVEITKSVVNELEPQIIEKKLKMEELYGDNIPIFQADKKLLRMVFQNLLSNAVKYTPSEGLVRIELLVALKGQNFGGKNITEDSITIKISDTGMGIPDKQKDKIFLKLFRADNARETETEGTGLGLYIIKSIVDHSEGLIWFESEENKGSTFYVVFPLSGMKKKEGTKKLD